MPRRRCASWRTEHGSCTTPANGRQPRGCPPPGPGRPARCSGVPSSVWRFRWRGSVVSTVMSFLLAPEPCGRPVEGSLMTKHLPKPAALVTLSVVVFLVLFRGSGEGQQVVKEGETRPPGPERDALQMIKE